MGIKSFNVIFMFHTSTGRLVVHVKSKTKRSSFSVYVTFVNLLLPRVSKNSLKWSILTEKVRGKGVSVVMTE